MHACINSACNYYCCCCWAPSRLERRNHLNFSHSSSANPTKSEKSTTTHFYFPIHRKLEIITISKDCRRADESTAKFGSKLCATGVLKERVSERGMMVGATNRSLGNIRSCHLYDAACTRVTTCTCTAVHSRLTWSFYFILFLVN